MIVKLTEMKAHLRVLADDENTLIASYIIQAQEAASDYCGIDWENAEDAPETVRLAVFLFVAYFYENRDVSDKTGYSTMMDAFHALLYPNRRAEVLFG